MGAAPAVRSGAFGEDLREPPFGGAGSAGWINRIAHQLRRRGRLRAAACRHFENGGSGNISTRQRLATHSALLGGVQKAR